MERYIPYFLFIFFHIYNNLLSAIHSIFHMNLLILLSKNFETWFIRKRNLSHNFVILDFCFIYVAIKSFWLHLYHEFWIILYNAISSIFVKSNIHHIFFDKKIFRYSSKNPIFVTKFFTAWFTFCYHDFSIKVKFLRKILFIWEMRLFSFLLFIYLYFVFVNFYWKNWFYIYIHFSIRYSSIFQEWIND